MVDGGTERRRPCGNVERPRHAPRQRPFGGRGGDLAIALACIVALVLMALCAWLVYMSTENCATNRVKTVPRYPTLQSPPSTIP